MPKNRLPLKEALSQAVEHHNNGRLKEAENLYKAIMREVPGHPDANHNLGVLAVQRNNPHDGLPYYKAALEAHPGFKQYWLSYIRCLTRVSNYNMALSVLHQARDSGIQGQELDKLEAMIQDALVSKNKSKLSLTSVHGLPDDQVAAVVSLYNNARFTQAAVSAQRMTEQYPDHYFGWKMLGMAQSRNQQHTHAISALKKAAELNPSDFEIWDIQGHIMLGMGHKQQALEYYNRSLELNPDSTVTQNCVGIIHYETGNREQALKHYQMSLDINPDHAEAHNNMGNACKDMGHLDQAKEHYRHALAVKPDFAEAHCNLGNLYRDLCQTEKAVEHYRKALAVKPDLAAIHNNLANSLSSLGQDDAAIEHHTRAAKLNPNCVLFHSNLGNLLFRKGRMPEALHCAAEAYALDPENDELRLTFIHRKRFLCHWDSLSPLLEKGFGKSRELSGTVAPFILFCENSTPDEQLKAAKTYSQKHLPVALNLRTKLESLHTVKDSPVLHIGYLSADFRSHPVGMLMSGLPKAHDRERFKVFAYSFGPDDNSRLRKKFQQDFDVFRDIKDTSHLEAARLIRRDGIDILVDLTGYTDKSRPMIAALRPAPVQVNYLGFPGTMGAEFIDWIIADRFIIPESQEQFYSEQIALLPHCYQINDNQRVIAAECPAREECGLPEHGFVFCCLNSHYKITPEIFSIWMNLLKMVPDSVLWLLVNIDQARDNLKNEAVRAGIDPKRVIFADRVTPDKHLARHSLADLFLDTYPVNAHTTASECLWAGLPLLTLAGDTFISRVAGSILNTMGLPELITYSYEEYQARALELAADSEQLQSFRLRIQNNRLNSPLFDTQGTVDALEELYLNMWERKGALRII